MFRVLLPRHLIQYVSPVLLNWFDGCVMKRSATLQLLGFYCRTFSLELSQRKHNSKLRFLQVVKLIYYNGDNYLEKINYGCLLPLSPTHFVCSEL